MLFPKNNSGTYPSTCISDRYAKIVVEDGFATINWKNDKTSYSFWPKGQHPTHGIPIKRNTQKAPK